MLGDAHGTACAPRATRLVEEVLSGLGYRVRRNDPYAGGYVTRHYGRPREGVHALQIEIARPLYMDEARIERLPRMAALQADLTRLIAGAWRLAGLALGPAADPARARRAAILARRNASPPTSRFAIVMTGRAGIAAKKGGAEPPPSLGRKRPRKQTTRQRRVAAMHKLGPFRHLASGFLRRTIFPGGTSHGVSA